MTVLLKPETKKLQYIDTLRGVAIMMVMLVHTTQVVPDLPFLTNTLADLGKLGVQLFFVLSAYTLCLSASKRQKEDNPLLFFYIRRFFRIAPLYYLGIALYGLYHLAIGADTSYFTLKNILANVFFVHGFYIPANNTIVPGGWSIGTEMAFYAIFPFVFYFYKRRVRNRTGMLLFPLVAMVCCLLLTQLLLYISNYSLNENAFLYFNLLNQLPVFLLGISYYCFTRKYIHVSLPAASFVWPAVCYALVLAAGFFFFRDNITSKPFIAGLIFVVLLQLVKKVKSLNVRFLSRIGQLSYAMYLFHFVFAWSFSGELALSLSPFLDAHLVLLICYLTTILATLITAVISEKTLERYGTACGRLLIRLMKAGRVPVTEAKT
ncbi:acyltransferase [Pontibacter sp. Tf4]|uniref:acyltransferase family protein n=1 Tax=Pontibacter sp. Tf4 TaxID=2761620 RepID=UPI00162A8364|nr:acyltransferase [Pontibacter sp. Tf4]MBB6609947.1 acyltransferase [Pontibacter sp. Tf4]